MKGQTHLNLLMVGVLAVVFILFMLMVIIYLREIWGEHEEDANCIDQVIAHHAVATATENYANLDIVCPTKHIEMEISSNDEALHLLASEMASCYRTWGRGEYKLFGENNGTYCHVCSLVDIEGLEEVTGLPTFLKDTPTPNGEQKYIEYLAGTEYGTYFDDATFRKHADHKISTEKGIGVIFHYAKGYDWLTRLRLFTVNNPWVGLVGGAVLAGTTVSTFGGSTGFIAVATVAGADVGATASLASRPTISHTAVVVARELSPDEISSLGCEYAPVRES